MKYAQEIGWTLVPRAEAELRRGFDPERGKEFFKAFKELRKTIKSILISLPRQNAHRPYWRVLKIVRQQHLQHWPTGEFEKLEKELATATQLTHYLPVISS